jgi:hypothetical protein
LHCSFKGGFIEILVEFWNSYFSWWLLEECAAFFFFFLWTAVSSFEIKEMGCLLRRSFFGFWI